MTPHLHSSYVDGCCRCDLSRDESVSDDDAAERCDAEIAISGASPIRCDKSKGHADPHYAATGEAQWRGGTAWPVVEIWVTPT